MGDRNDEAAQFPRATDARPREAKKNQPEYLGDKVDRAVHLMEEEGTEMSPEAERLQEEGERALDELRSEGQDD